MARAQRLYNVKHVEMLWEREHDSLALIGWGHKRLVLALRGSPSLKRTMGSLAVSRAIVDGTVLCNMPTDGPSAYSMTTRRKAYLYRSIYYCRLQLSLHELTYVHSAL